MPTKGEPHESLVLFEDDLYRTFFYFARDFSTWVNEEQNPNHDETVTSLATIGGAALLIEELLKKESNDDEV